MKLEKQHHDTFTFQMPSREKELLCRVLEFYPLLDPSHHRIKRDDQDQSQMEEQQLFLIQTMEEVHRQNRHQLTHWGKAMEVFSPTTEGYRLTLKLAQIDWLLQILNDIRVGSWVKLGSPVDKERDLETLDEDQARFLWLMEVCGYFQMHLLAAIDGTTPT